MKATAKNQGNIKRMLQVLAMSMLIVAFAGCKGTTDSGPNNSQVLTQVKQKMTGEWIEFGTANKISVTGDLIKYEAAGINFQVKYEPISADSIKIIKGSDYKWQSPSITYHRVSFSDNNGSISISNFVPTDAAATYPANHKDMKIAKGEEQLKSLVGTKWKLVGFGDTKTGNIKAAEPKALPGHEDKIYFMHFDSDSSFKGYTSTNEMYGKYIADYSKKTIWTELITSMIKEFGDGRLFKEILHSNATRTFSATAKTFKIFYNNGESYMLFDIFIK